MSLLNFLIINGPNLGHVGQREPDIYGREGMESLSGLVHSILGKQAEQIKLELFQSNSEGSIIDRCELAWKERLPGIVLNAGAYTHTSLALADCLAWVGIPCVEVHLSNVMAREEIRHKSVIAKHCLGTISGFGLMSYVLGIQALLAHLQVKETPHLS